MSSTTFAFSSSGFTDLYIPASDISPQDLQALKNHSDRDIRTALARDGATNPFRQENRHSGFNGLHDRSIATDEDILFSGVNREGNGVAMFHELEDGTVRMVLPLGTPPDQVAKFTARLKLEERKSKLKAHLKKKVAEKTKPKQKRERTETAEEYAARWKATAELLGKEEAAKLQDAEFWEGPQQVAAMD